MMTIRPPHAVLSTEAFFGRAEKSLTRE